MMHLIITELLPRQMESVVTVAFSNSLNSTLECWDPVDTGLTLACINLSEKVDRSIRVTLLEEHFSEWYLYRKHCPIRTMSSD